MLIEIKFKHIAGVAIMLIGAATQLLIAERLLGAASAGFMAFFVSIWLGGCVMILPDRKRKHRRKSEVVKMSGSNWTSVENLKKGAGK